MKFDSVCMHSELLRSTDSGGAIQMQINRIKLHLLQKIYHNVKDYVSFLNKGSTYQ